METPTLEEFEAMAKTPVPPRRKRRITMCFFDDVLRKMIEDLERIENISIVPGLEKDAVDRFSGYIATFKDYLGEG